MGRSAKPSPTKERILEVAESLFARHGLDGTSMRDITEAAGVNLASVNYHFGSKDGLISAVFQRHLAPVNAARLAALDALEASAASQPPELDAVLEAFIRPAMERAMGQECANDSFIRLMGRCLSEPAAYAERHILPHFKIVRERFDAAVARALPDLPKEEIFWLMSFVGGALHHALHLWSRRDSVAPLRGSPMNPEELVRQLIAFAAAGLRARSVVPLFGDSVCA